MVKLNAAALILLGSVTHSETNATQVKQKMAVVLAPAD